MLFRSMRLDGGHERLYVGAKNTLYSLSLERVDSHHREVGVRVCVCVSHLEPL